MQVENEQSNELEQAVLKLNFKVFGMAFGVILGLIIFIATNWLIVKGELTNTDGTEAVGPHLALLGNFFIGYSVSFIGSLVGFLYGFALGSICGSVISVLYSLFVKIRGNHV